MHHLELKRLAPRISRRHLFVALIALAASTTVLSACFRNNKEDEALEPTPPTYLKVENRAFLDMTMYAIRSSQRIRLGIATGNTTTKLLIPSSLIGGTGALQFLANPIGGRRSPISQEISVSAGDEVTLMIPPG